MVPGLRTDRGYAIARGRVSSALLTRELKNVIVFTLGGPGGERHAAELRWIREVVTLGFVTMIPGAPPGLAGAVNLRGNLVVTASVMFGNLYIAPLLLAFMRRHPQVRARSFLSDRVVDLVAEGIDVAVRIAHLKD